jgi:hypothetical protein
MPAGKSRNYPLPGSHEKCQSCPIGLLCLSGRRQFGKRYWCRHCRGAYYLDLDMTIRCVVFRSKRGRYQDEQPRCPACAVIGMHIHDSIYYDIGQGCGHGRIVIGITHKDAREWRERRGNAPQERSAGPGPA